jgi:hypothetical protein
MPNDTDAMECSICGYDRTGITDTPCPECGSSDAAMSQANLKAWHDGKRICTLAIVVNPVLFLLVFAAGVGPMLAFGAIELVAVGWLITAIHGIAVFASFAMRIAHMGEPCSTHIHRWQINILFLPLALDVLALATIWIYYAI